MVLSDHTWLNVLKLKELGLGCRFKYPEYGISEADEFIRADLREKNLVEKVTKFFPNNDSFFEISNSGDIETFDEIYQFAVDMGGAGFVFTGENDAEIMQNSAYKSKLIRGSKRSQYSH